jgi:hypothetical protein
MTPAFLGAISLGTFDESFLYRNIVQQAAEHIDSAVNSSFICTPWPTTYSLVALDKF